MTETICLYIHTAGSPNGWYLFEPVENFKLCWDSGGPTFATEDLKVTLSLILETGCPSSYKYRFRGINNLTEVNTTHLCKQVHFQVLLGSRC